MYICIVLFEFVNRITLLNKHDCVRGENIYHKYIFSGHDTADSLQFNISELADVTW